MTTVDNVPFPDGVCFVALAGVASPDLLVSTIAAALDVTFYGSEEPKRQLLAYLKRRSLLLILDNFEHLLEGAELVTDLLREAPGVKVLTTSREPLNLQEEWLYPLGGMSFPGDEGEASRGMVADLTHYTAVQLFVQCARRMQPTFDLAQEGEAVVRICRLVGGMPLGIEMASSWLRHLSCTQIATEIERGLDFLATSLRNVPARHRSMRALFEHSWTLLPAEEQQVFAQLAIFRGGLLPAGAQAVVGASLSTLLALVDRSLLQLTPSGRFQLHELLRQFAEEKLRTTPHLWHETQGRHCLYYTAYLQQQEHHLKGREQYQARHTIEAEIENIRAAWHWAVSQRKVDELERALEGLYIFYLLNHWYKEGEAAFSNAAAALTMEEPAGRQGILLAKVLARQGSMLAWSVMFMGESKPWEKVEALYCQSLAILHQLEARGETGLALSGLSAVCWEEGKHEQALHLNQQALTVFAERNDHWEMSRILGELGYISFQIGAYEQAIQYCRQGITLCEERGDSWRLVAILTFLAEAHGVLGEYDHARQTIQAALTAESSSDNKGGIAWSLQLLADVAWRIGDYEMAQAYAQQGLALFQEIGMTRQQGITLNTLGNIACSLGHYRQARNRFCAVLGLTNTGVLHRSWYIAETLLGLATLLFKEGEPVQATELLELSLQHPAIWQVTKERVKNLLAELQAILPADQFAAAQTRGRTADLRATVAALAGASTLDG